MGPRQLSGRLGIAPGAATELVDRLERAGHLERRRDTVDRRRVHLIPTASALDQVGEELRPLIAALDSVVADTARKSEPLFGDTWVMFSTPTSALPLQRQGRTVRDHSKSLITIDCSREGPTPMPEIRAPQSSSIRFTYI